MLDLKPLYKVEMHEKRNAHYYSIDGNPTLFPGSTTALNIINKPYLIPWAAKQAALKIEFYLHTHATERKLSKDEITRLVAEGRKAHVELKDKAADLGTRAHKAIDDITSGNKPIITPDIAAVVDGFLTWQASSKLKIIHGDLKLIFLWKDAAGLITSGYGGSLDGLAVDENGRFVVIDYKTSNSIGDTYALQIASYCYGLKYTYGLDYVPAGYCVRFGKTEPEVEVAKLVSVEDSFFAFGLSLQLHDHMKRTHFHPSTYAVGSEKKKFFKTTNRRSNK